MESHQQQDRKSHRMKNPWTKFAQFSQRKCFWLTSNFIYLLYTHARTHHKEYAAKCHSIQHIIQLADSQLHVRRFGHRTMYASVHRFIWLLVCHETVLAQKKIIIMIMSDTDWFKLLRVPTVGNVVVHLLLSRITMNWRKIGTLCAQLIQSFVHTHWFRKMKSNWMARESGSWELELSGTYFKN